MDATAAGAKIGDHQLDGIGDFSESKTDPEAYLIYNYLNILNDFSTAPIFFDHQFMASQLLNFKLQNQWIGFEEFFFRKPWDVPGFP